MHNRLLWAGAVVVALFQSVILGSMIEGRASVLRNGEEVVLKTIPVDPRDLLRGRYVTLRYQISRLDGALFDVIDGELDYFPKDVFVVAALDATNGLKPKQVFFDDDVTLGQGERLVRARLDRNYSASDFVEGREIGLSYGIERFYVPEYDALKIEQSYRDDNIPVDVVVALSGKGKMQIKRLVIDGKVAYDEPFY